MLDPADFLDAAQAQAEGKSSRIPHWCGAGTPLTVTHKAEGWSAWCYRCQEKGWVPKPLPTLAEKAARKAAQRDADGAVERDPRPPMPPIFDVQQWPLPARVWLYKAGLFVEDIAQLGAYYHEKTGRVVLPVMQDGAVAFWQARSVDGRMPKYLNPRVDRSSLVAQYGAGPCIVLTEDILSAYRVGMATEAWSLLGVRLATPVLARLLKDGRPVLVWLDNDPVPNNPGQAAAAVIMRTLTNVGIKCHNIVTEKDPKLYSRAEVKEVVCRSMSLLSA